MMVLITYDVNITSDNGSRRLRLVAKACMNHGRRVQNSVFECVLDNAQFISLRKRLQDIIDVNTDSIRFYFLGNNWQNKVEQIGNSEIVDVENDTFII
ncbi:MAG: CRISPR-associated endonuclease Cas2 [Bacteroidales bacterium]|nr:CRISPR-associated endonuclease Cas2 [Bacteroidales bacterium]